MDLYKFLINEKQESYSTVEALYDKLKGMGKSKEIFARGESGMLEITDASNADNPDEIILKGNKRGTSPLYTVKRLTSELGKMDGDCAVFVEYDGERVEILGVEETVNSVILYVY